MSVVRAHSLGFPNVVATFGAKVTAHQIELLRRWREIYVWFDSDSAGYGGEQKLVQGLYRHSGVRVVIPDLGRDAGDCVSDDQFLSKIAAAVPAVVRMIDYGRSTHARR
jgi:DNA primase